MSDRYSLIGDARAAGPVWKCRHCGCLVWDPRYHDVFNGLDLVDVSDNAMQGSTPLAPPEPPA